MEVLLLNLRTLKTQDITSVSISVCSLSMLDGYRGTPNRIDSKPQEKDTEMFAIDFGERRVNSKSEITVLSLRGYLPAKLEIW